MDIDANLLARSNGECELCSSSEKLQTYAVPSSIERTETEVCICGECFGQLTGDQPMDANHWRCLNNSMWSSVPAVKVVAWRMLNALIEEGWPKDLLEIFYMDEDVLDWAKETSDTAIAGGTEDVVVHKDSNGNKLTQGDSVVLIKDLEVKGGGFTAKRGTAVRNISLVEGNADQIEGKINGQQIVILTQYTKKSN